LRPSALRLRLEEERVAEGRVRGDLRTRENLPSPYPLPQGERENNFNDRAAT
jgi:hypothetical protein